MRVRVIGTCVAAACIAVLAASCLIAEAPAELPRLPQGRPVVVSTDPPAGIVVGSLPQEFVVVVELIDPSQTFAWAAFLDYRYDQREQGLQVERWEKQTGGTSSPESGGGNVRTITFSFGPLPDAARCHSIRFVAAFDMANFRVGVPAAGSGSDSVTWLYNPNGEFGGCPSFDAGGIADGSFPPLDADLTDAALDAGHSD